MTCAEDVPHRRGHLRATGRALSRRRSTSQTSQETTVPRRPVLGDDENACGVGNAGGIRRYADAEILRIDGVKAARPRVPFTAVSTLALPAESLRSTGSYASQPAGRCRMV